LSYLLSEPKDLIAVIYEFSIQVEIQSIQFMDDYIDDIDKINVVERLIRREQAIRDRQNPFVNYSEDEFMIRETVLS
jgi:hypothetical protein